MIGNKLGRMLDIDEKIRSLVITSLAKISVEMNLGDGLPDGKDIQVGEHSTGKKSTI